MARGRWSLAWLRPPKVSPGGVMSLADHLRELRYRIIVIFVVVVLASVLVAFWYDELYQVMLRPYQLAIETLQLSNPGLSTAEVISGVTTPFVLALKVCVVAGLVVSSPLWIYQIWAYIVPALHANERRWALIFMGAAIPLFLLGVFIGYIIMPQGIAVMLSFTPDSVPITNLLEVQDYLELTLRLMVVFGLGFLMPVVVVGLNLVGVVSAVQLARARNYVIFGTFVFGAAATPSTDPFSMLALSLPMVVLYLVAEVIARIHDRRKARDSVEVTA